jgi:release factor glutamine methyltransferase
MSPIVTTLRAAGCVFAEDEAQLLTEAAANPHHLAALVNRRVAGEPLEHILGWAQFRGLRVAVDPGVFVPRRRTEHLVHHAVALAPPDAVIVELCCGCGAIGAAITAELDTIELHAADIDPAAVRCARRNITRGEVHQGDLYQPLPTSLRGRVDIVVANAPYVPTDKINMMPPEARDHESQTALDGGTDGLAILRRVVTEAPAWLIPGGHVLVESSERQAPKLVQTMRTAGLSARVDTDEDLYATVVIGTKATPTAERNLDHRHGGLRGSR